VSLSEFCEDICILSFVLSTQAFPQGLASSAELRAETWFQWLSRKFDGRSGLPIGIPDVIRKFALRDSTRKGERECSELLTETWLHTCKSHLRVCAWKLCVRMIEKMNSFMYDLRRTSCSRLCSALRHRSRGRTRCGTLCGWTQDCRTTRSRWRFRPPRAGGSISS
jgi:hypothetical protein